MKFTVVIPTYNRSQFIIKTIQSVLNQSYTDFEVIVVDDGSTDNTEEAVKSIPDTRVFYYKKTNAERGAARNFGTLKAKGEYVTFLDSDDLLYPEHLQDASQLILKNNTPEAFHLGYEIKNEYGKTLYKIDDLPSIANRILIKGNTLSCLGVFLRNDIAVKNLFNENRLLSGLEDWELWLRIAVQFPIYTSNTITSTMINHDERSVLSIPKEEQIARFDVLFSLVLSNPLITNYYKGSLNVFKSSCYSYIALHLALAKKYKKDSISYLIKSIAQSPVSVFTRRFLAIIKHLVLGLG